MNFKNQISTFEFLRFSKDSALENCGKMVTYSGIVTPARTGRSVPLPLVTTPHGLIGRRRDVPHNIARGDDTLTSEAFQIHTYSLHSIRAGNYNFISLHFHPHKNITYIFITNTKHKIASLKVHFDNARPIIVGNGCLVAQHHNATGR